MASWSAKGHLLAGKRGPAQHVLPLDSDWLFGGELDTGTLEPGFNDAAFSKIMLPHCVTPLSWQKWDPATWENVWIYRRHFAKPVNLGGGRVFLHFDRIMAAATPVLNGHSLEKHLGGYLPFQREVTDLLQDNNELSVEVDSRWMSVPPAGSPKGARAVDYLLPGGITGSVNLRIVPQVFISDVFAKPMNVLDSNRHLEVTCTVDAGALLPGQFHLSASLQSGSGIIAKTSKSVVLEKIGESQTVLKLTNLQDIMLWDVSAPHLYDLVVTLFHNNKPLHDYQTRVGFREARFDLDGFFLNGKRLQLFGLNRHELYPYVGYAMPRRVLRRDAEILRHKFNCNIVRCSHYPQSEAFLDACDELGLMVWEETPGWQYIGDQSWQDIALGNVKDMVRRDRNRPSVVIWGVRINESRNDPAFYRRTREAAKLLDGSRPTSGTMTPSSLKNWSEEWHQDVFAFDDYHAAPDGSVGIREPLPGVPYMITETVGQFNYGIGGKGFDRKYRRAGDPRQQEQQALLHAQAHSKSATYPRCAGAIAWCAFDYASLLNAYEGVKCPGVADSFRIPKLGASFYLAQVDPKVRPMIEPSFYWDFGPHTPSGPGERAAIFSNCDRLELSISGKPHAVLHPDLAGFPNIKYPPFFADLRMDDAAKPELRIDGYIGSALVLSRSFSADSSADQLSLQADDIELHGDGSDATRLAFGAVDKFGAPRPFVEGEVSFEIEGPGVIVGDNPFQLADSGGVGAVWIKSISHRTGRIKIRARNPSLGNASVEIRVRQDQRQLRRTSLLAPIAKSYLRR